MDGNNYQELAMRTNNEHAQIRLTDKILLGIMNHQDVAGLVNGLLGLSGEAGELTDLFKKWIFHDAPLDEEHAKKELGDVCWYIAMICHSMGWDMDEIMQMNIDKLKTRYPEGFSTEKSNHRKEDDV